MTKPYLLFLLLLLPGIGHADDDHERARQLVEQGAILPLEQIIEQARGQHDWRLLEAELEEKRGRFMYEIEWLDAQGRVHEIYYDASSGQVLKEEIED